MRRRARAPGWVNYSEMDDARLEREANRQTLLHAAADRDGLDRERGPEQPRPDARRQHSGGTQHRQAGDRRVGIDAADARMLAQQRIRLAEAVPTLAGQRPSLRGVDQEGDREGTRQGSM